MRKSVEIINFNLKINSCHNFAQDMEKIKSIEAFFDTFNLTTWLLLI